MLPKPKEVLIERLQKRTLVNSSTKCHEWQGTKDSWGYGVISFGNSRKKVVSWRVHRLAWTVFKGEIPKGLLVLHHCDNPKCLNVEHLYIGTDADNSADRERRGRAGNHKGEYNGKAKLKYQQVLEIRNLYKPRKVTRKQLAKKYNVSVSAIRKIVNDINWKPPTNIDETLKLIQKYEK